MMTTRRLQHATIPLASHYAIRKDRLFIHSSSRKAVPQRWDQQKEGNQQHLLCGQPLSQSKHHPRWPTPIKTRPGRVPEQQKDRQRQVGRKVEVVTLHHRFLRLMCHPFHSHAPFQRCYRRTRLRPTTQRCNNSLLPTGSSYHCMVILSTKTMAATSMAESIPTFPSSIKSGGCKSSQHTCSCGTYPMGSLETTF